MGLFWLSNLRMLSTFLRLCDVVTIFLVNSKAVLYRLEISSTECDIVAFESVTLFDVKGLTSSWGCREHILLGHFCSFCYLFDSAHVGFRPRRGSHSAVLTRRSRVPPMPCSWGRGLNCLALTAVSDVYRGLYYLICVFLFFYLFSLFVTGVEDYCALHCHSAVPRTLLPCTALAEPSKGESEPSRPHVLGPYYITYSSLSKIMLPLPLVPTPPSLHCSQPLPRLGVG